ncbi:helix-turn-helix domain-containing protein [Microbacterium sp. USTB-Y]|uniref:helix-turn-helix domain-containing protein n=1 Tax=Microbacterium sp. USTB-Y TaxID=2823692 RepID=UPI00203E43CD|nr:helix-turn-helix domain-containing protein [Microbacterium sp. USTB-Y]
MSSVARAEWDLVLWEDPDGVHAGLQGPESRATKAAVPVGADFVGIRVVRGAILPALPGVAMVDRFIPLRVADGRLGLFGERLDLPGFDDAERFVETLVRGGLLVRADLESGAMLSERTRQRRYLSAVGLPLRTVRQIERAADAAVLLRAGGHVAEVAHEAGYFDQPHLARSLRRFIGPSATGLTDSGDGGTLSLLYKTGREETR